MRKKLSYVILELHNVRMEPLNVRKKVRESLNVTKELSYVMLKLHNVRMKPSNVRKKSKGTTKCEKKTVICDVGTTYCEDGTIKCEKKVREPPNVRNELALVILELHNVKMEPSNMRKKVTWCSRLPTSGYYTPSFFRECRRITREFQLVQYDNVSDS